MKTKTITTITIVIIFIAVCIITIGCTAAFTYNDHTYIGTVTDKERINTEDGSYYLIFTEDIYGCMHVLKNEDNILRMKVDSSNIYGSLKIGETYNFTVIGYRIPLFSMYENILSIN